MIVRRYLLCACVVAVTAPVLARAEGLVAWKVGIEQVMVAIKIAAKQSEVSASRSDQMLRQAGQAEASAKLDTYNREQIRRVMDEYGPTSQLVDPCYQVAMAGTTLSTNQSAGGNAQAAMARIYTINDQGKSNAGGVSGLFGATIQSTSVPFAAQLSKRIARHSSRYCTVSEAKAGYCALNANGMQGGDSDFSLHASPGKTFGWDQAEAATDFIKTVAPVKALPKSSRCTDVECLSTLAVRRQQEAYISMARFSMMRFVESRVTQASGDAKIKDSQ